MTDEESERELKQPVVPMEILPAFNLGDLVQQKTDRSKVWVVVGIRIRPDNGLLYDVASGSQSDTCYDIELVEAGIKDVENMIL